MKREDFQILSEVLDIVEDLQRRTGGNPRWARESSLRRLRQEMMRFEQNCRDKTIMGKARKRKAQELFRQILSLRPNLWST